MKRIISELIIVTSITFVMIVSTTNVNSKEVENKLFNKVIDSLSVYSEVTSLLGLENLNLKSASKQNFNKNISKTVFTDSVTPFIHNELSKKNTWKVSYESIYLTTSEITQYNKPMSVTIYMDEENGKPLSIFCESLLEEDIIAFRPPTYLEAEEVLTLFGELYLGIPDEKPIISFTKALEVCFRRNSAKEITGTYVNYKFKDLPAEPAWVIYMRGINPIPMRSGYEFETTVFRYVVNAVTGKLMFSLNSPYPPLYDEMEELNKESKK